MYIIYRTPLLGSPHYKLLHILIQPYLYKFYKLLHI